MNQNVQPTENELAEIRQQLNSRLVKLRISKENLEKEADGLVGEVVGQVPPVYSLPSDHERIGADRSVLFEMLERVNREIAEVVGAEERLRSGTYGKCAVCKKQIPVSRLLAMPETQSCGPCKVNLEREESLHRHVPQFNRHSELSNLA